MAGTLKLDLAQFRDLEAFATFGSELDEVSQAQLDRGYRLVELLKQPLNSPMPVEEQVVSIYAGTAGFLDDLPVDEVRRFETELLEWVPDPPRRPARRPSATPGRCPTTTALRQAVDDFKASFVADTGRAASRTRRRPTRPTTDAERRSARPRRPRPLDTE